MALKPARLQWSDDGSLRSLDYGDVYFQSGQGFNESHYVFLEQNRLPERFKDPPENNFRIAELGFGSGLNFLLTAELWAKTAPPDARLTYVSIEKHPILREDLQKIYAAWPRLTAHTSPLLEQYPPLIEGFHHLHFLDGRIQLTLLFGDVANVLPELSGTFDAWYLDGFTPSRNPDMWTDKLFPQIAARTRAGGTLATFSVAGHMRRGLQACGFEVQKIKGFGVKWSMTVARMAAAPHADAPPVRHINILGAGLAGASAAHALAKRGCKVTVYDQAEAAAAETSGNPAGIVYPKITVAPSAMGTFHQHGFCFTRNLATSLKLPSWHACGVTHLDGSDEERERHQKLGAQGYPADFLHYNTGLQHPIAGYLSPPEFCRALLDHPNIEMRFDQAVEKLPNGITVIALNHGSKAFSATSWLPLETLRGQITYLKPTTESKKLAHVICHDGYITPPFNGAHIAGATFRRETPGDTSLRDAEHAENLQKLNAALPELGFTAAQIIGGRAGFRTATPDRLPLIGPCPDHDTFLATHHVEHHTNLYLSTAFGSFGTTGTPLAGEIVACMITGDPLPVPASLLPALLPERFLLRNLKRGKI